MELTQRDLGKVLADAAFICFKDHGKSFPDFNTMGDDMAENISARFDRIEKNPKVYSNYFQQEFNFSLYVNVRKNKNERKH